MDVARATEASNLDFSPASDRGESSCRFATPRVVMSLRDTPKHENGAIEAKRRSFENKALSAYFRNRNAG